MGSNQEVMSLSSLCRYTLKDEHLITDLKVKQHIASTFEENRAFPFFVDGSIVFGLKQGGNPSSYTDAFTRIRNDILDTLFADDPQARNRIISDVRLNSRLQGAISWIHRAVASHDFKSLETRRFVIIKEKYDEPTLYHVSNETTVLSHVGQGPPWAEIPTIYLGLNIFEALTFEEKRGENTFFNTFLWLLRIEERAIETGYSHIEVASPDVSESLNHLLDEVIRISSFSQVEYREIPERKKTRRFTERNRQTYLQMLDRRLSNDPLNFDHDINLKAITSLERLARRYKKGDDHQSLREIVRLLVAASGHDFHEIRDRANYLLERVFSLKEFDAPLATSFVNIKSGDVNVFNFTLPEKKGKYFLRIYRNTSSETLLLEQDITYDDHDLVYDAERELYTVRVQFDEPGQCDYLVFRKKRKLADWMDQHGCSGRINVLPDVRGEIVLEIFPDIHGHTRIYWMDEKGHPGLVYNENGQVIRLGRFSDISAHLEDLKQRYKITAIYLLGVQKRGSNYENWDPSATSPSPFSPMSLVEIEDFLGGEEEFKELISRAHELDIKIIVDVVPHVNRRSEEIGDDLAVQCYDGNGNLVIRAATDGRYGSWDDGKLLNYRKFEIWEWLVQSVLTLIEKYDIDGIRFDSAHAVPVMMKKNNFPLIYDQQRSHESMVEGGIIVNDREDGHFLTTGYFDSACRDVISIPFHYYLMLNIERKLRQTGKQFFVHLAECYWGHERYLARNGIIPYNSALYKICENIITGKTDVREIYHIYDNYFPGALPKGTELLGILGNHDEHRALSTFGLRGLRAAVALTSFMNNMIMDYEGSAEGEGWKVYLDNIYVNWNQFEYASHRSLEPFYRSWYTFHRENRGDGYLIWANNNMVAGALKFTEDTIWIGAFNFADSSQNISLQLDNPGIPLDDTEYYRVADPVYSPITGHYSYYTGEELRVCKIHTIVSYTDRVKLLRLEPVDGREDLYNEFLRDSFFRLCTASNIENFSSYFSFQQVVLNSGSYGKFEKFVRQHMIPLFWETHRNFLELGLKRILFHMYRINSLPGATILEYMNKLAEHKDFEVRELGLSLLAHNSRGSIVFMSAETEPFSKSGGLANVVYELPREMARLGEEVYVITPMYRHGDAKAVEKMQKAIQQYDITYTGRNVRFMIEGTEYEVGVYHGMVEGIHYYLLDHHEFFDGLYWGYTSEEKLRRRVAFSRACVEVIMSFGLAPLFTFTNDAFAGIFNGIVKSDPLYNSNPNFMRTTFLHIIHNGGWQYFDSYHRVEGGKDLFGLFNLPGWRGIEFEDPVHHEKLNCMAAGVRFADTTVTVSPSYAKQVEIACDGLEHLLQDVIGISNAIGNDFRERVQQRFDASGFVEEWYPALMKKVGKNADLEHELQQRYPEILTGAYECEKIQDVKRNKIVTRMRNKLLTQVQRGFSIDPDCVLFCMIHRVAEQKGFQLLLESSDGIFNTLGFQGIIGGSVASGDDSGYKIADGLLQLNGYYPDKVSVNMGFQDVSIPLLSSDVFLMPSMNEPGGISQLEAFACGCLVVARATGGLRDTVFPIREKAGEVAGNGFLFSDFTAWSFYDAMERCMNFYRYADENVRYAAQVNAEKSVYFWDTPARKYLETIYSLKEIVRILD